MKKLIFILVVVILIALVLKFGLGLGLGFGYKDGDGKSNPSQDEVQSNEEKDNIEMTGEEETIIKISVIGNEYYFENERILLDDFISKIENEEDIIVEIKDDKASLKAYNNLINRLDDLDIPYKEY